MKKRTKKAIGVSILVGCGLVMWGAIAEQQGPIVATLIWLGAGVMTGIVCYAAHLIYD